MKLRGSLFTKYVSLIGGLVALVLLASGGLGIYFLARESDSEVRALQQEKARGAATRIDIFLRDIEHQMGWASLPLPTQTIDPIEQRRIECLKLFRQVPAISEVIWLDTAGKEQLRISRLAIDVSGSGADHSKKLSFSEVSPSRAYFSDVHFRRETEPYMTIARSAGSAGGVMVVEVNLKFIWDLITEVKVGEEGLAYLVDSSGTLIAHPDISLVLQKRDLSGLSQVAALRGSDAGEPHFARDLLGRYVLTAHAPIQTTNWNVFVELPLEEAFAPLLGSIYRTGLLLAAGLALSVLASMFLARRMLRPILALQQGAEQIRAGRLDVHIDVQSGDELESLADRFNRMTAQLREAQAELEQKVEERTRQLSGKNVQLNETLEKLDRTRAQLEHNIAERTLQQRLAESANLSKSRFLAAASHDLRQPITTIGLLADLLRERLMKSDLAALARQLAEAARALELLLVGLLDVSRLDANVEPLRMETISLQNLFESVRAHEQTAADLKGLRLRFRSHNLNVLSDLALLGRELRNLVDNAIRYTRSGGVLVAARARGPKVCIQVWDTGIGIPADEQEHIFEEFYQVGNVARDRQLGTGLGLAIVQRTAKLLGHTVEVRSKSGKGSCFSIAVPRSMADPMPPEVAGAAEVEPLLGWDVWLVEDDMALAGALSARLREWGAEVRHWPDAETVLLESQGLPAPDALITDVRLPGRDGLELIEELRRRLGPSLSSLMRVALISGDTDPSQLSRIAASGLDVLAKPFRAEALLALLAHGPEL